MRELIFIENSTSEFKGKKYTISQFIDCYNYKVLYATDLPNCDDLLKGHQYLCDFKLHYSRFSID